MMDGWTTPWTLMLLDVDRRREADGSMEKLDVAVGSKDRARLMEECWVMDGWTTPWTLMLLDVDRRREADGSMERLDVAVGWTLTT